MIRRTHGLVLALGLVGCFGTESGNPPLAVEAEITIGMNGGELEIVGNPGAVEPPEAEVQLLNVNGSGAPLIVAVEPNGSFVARLPGNPNHEIRLVAVDGPLRSNQVVRSLLPNDPLPTDCAGLSALEADVSADNAVTVRVTNGCATPLTVRAPRFRFGDRGLRVDPDMEVNVAPMGFGEYTLQVDTSSEGLALEVVELSVSLGAGDDSRFVSAFIR